jgi:hypothetical protein
VHCLTSGLCSDVPVEYAVCVAGNLVIHVDRAGTSSASSWACSFLLVIKGDVARRVVEGRHSIIHVRPLRLGVLRQERNKTDTQEEQ